MAYITKDKDTMNKEDRNKISINKDLFAFASNFEDIYFANDLNWKKIAIHFKHITSNQKRIIVLLQDNDEGHFEVSAMARTGAWQIEQIQVFDKDGGMEAIQRAGIPEATAMDISVIRKIAPSELILSIANNKELTVSAGQTTNFLVGYTVRVWDEIALDYHDAVIYTITDVTGDVITLDQDILNHSGKTLRLKFPSYADASANQKGIFQFVGTLF